MGDVFGVFEQFCSLSIARFTSQLLRQSPDKKTVDGKPLLCDKGIAHEIQKEQRHENKSHSRCRVVDGSQRSLLLRPDRVFRKRGGICKPQLPPDFLSLATRLRALTTPFRFCSQVSPTGPQCSSLTVPLGNTRGQPSFLEIGVTPHSASCRARVSFSKIQAPLQSPTRLWET